MTKFKVINELTHLRTNRIVLNNFSKIDTLIDRNKNEFLLDTNDDELMKILTSICLVSKNFANSFFKNETLSKKELSTFYKYFLRMISRSIPFGNMVSIRSNGTTKKDIVEMDYLRFEILFEEKIVKNKKNLIKLTTTIKNSNAIRLNNTYFHVLVNDYVKNKRKIVKSNDVIEKVWELISIEGISTKILFNELCKQFKINQDECYFLVMKLYEINLITFILTEPKNSIQLNYQILESVLSDEKDKHLVTNLDSINGLLNLNKYAEIISLLKKIYKENESKYQFNIKSYDVFKENYDFNDIILEFYSKLVTIGLKMPLDDYKLKTVDYILEKYGQNIKIPLNRIFFEKTIIEHLDLNSQRQQFLQILNKEVKNIIMEMNFKNSYDLKEVNFFERLDDIISDFSINGNITGGDIIFDCLSDFDGTIKSSLILSEEGLTNHPGKMFGRFVADSEKVAQNYYKKFILSEEQIYKKHNIELVEFFSDHLDKSIYNIYPKKSCVQNVINFGYPINAKRYLDSNKLSIYVDSRNNLKLYSEELKSEIRLVNYNMFNPEMGNDLYLFLSNLFTDSRHIEIFSYIKETILDMRLSEKVTYGLLEIVRPQHTIYTSMRKEFKNRENFINYIISELENKKIISKTDRLVFYHSNFNKLLINLDSLAHIDIINKDIKRNKNLVFSKIPKKYLDTINNTNNQMLFKGEVVYSIQNSYIETSDIFPEELNTYIDEKILSITLFQKKDLHKELLLSMSEYLIRLESEEKILGFFFVKYIEEFKDCIRLRIVFKNTEDIYLLNIKKMFEIIFKNVFVDDYKIGPFRPEVSRYGGIKNIENVNRVFCSESLLLINLISDYTEVKDLECLSIILVLKIIAIFKCESEFKTEIHNYRSQIDVEIRQKYRQDNKKYLDKLIKLNNTYKGSKLLRDYETSLMRYEHFLEDNPKKYLIASSLIHMMCNRIFGVDRKKERKIRIYSNNILQYGKHVGKYW